MNWFGGQLALYCCVATKLPRAKWVAYQNQQSSLKWEGEGKQVLEAIRHGECADWMPSIFRFLAVLSIYSDRACRRNAVMPVPLSVLLS